MELVEKYKDIPDTEFVPLECVDERLIGLYEINKLGWVKTKSTGNIRKVYNSLSEKGYPKLTLSYQESKTVYIHKHYSLHILLAKTFISNPLELPEVDHIDKDRANYKLDNLRWVSSKENCHNRDKRPDMNIIYIKLNDKHEEIERISIKDIPSLKERNDIAQAINTGRRHSGFYWKRIYPDVENYINKFGPIEESNWKTCIRLPELECNPIGLVRVKKSKRFKFGSITDHGYQRIVYKNKGYMVHRLIYETFNDRFLNEDEVIDHINTDRLDNRIENLKSGTKKDNMNNPLTIEHIQKPVLQYSISGKLIKEFSSAKEVSKIFNIKLETIRAALFGGYVSQGYFWCYKENSYLIEDYLKKIIFKYNNFGDLISTFQYITLAANESELNSRILSKYIDTGDLAPDNHYYFHGPHKF